MALPCSKKMNCLYSFRTKSKLESHENLYKNKNVCGAVMSFKDIKILINTENLIQHHLLFMQISNLWSKE